MSETGAWISEKNQWCPARNEFDWARISSLRICAEQGPVPGKILIDDAEQTIKDFSNDYGEDDQDVLNVFRYCYNIAKTCSEHRDSWVSCFLTIFAGYSLESFEKEINDIGQTEKWYKGLTSKQLDLLKYINRENIRIPEKYIDNLKNLKKWYFGYNDSDEIQIYGIPKYLSKEQEKFIETLVKRRK